MMSRSCWAAVCLVALLAIAQGASAARVPPEQQGDGEGFRDAPLSLKSASRAWLSLLRDGDALSRKRRGAEEEETQSGLHNRIMCIKFFVNPHQSQDFEEAWLKMEKQERDADMISLKASALDNVVYHSYAEFKEHEDLHDHLTSGHFLDFAEWVDDKNVVWELELLQDIGTYVSRSHRKGEQEEQDQQGQGDWDKYVPPEYRHYIPDSYRPSKHHKHRKGDRRMELGAGPLAMLPADANDAEVTRLIAELTRRKESAHILVKYMVRPGEGADFIDAWTDCAQEAVKDKGNHVYSLRKVTTNNQVFYGYSSWASMRDWIDHLDSKHLGKFLDYLDDADVEFHITPLEMID